ncbi:O168 family O-antigen flippase, partial [Escherichia coli]|nr:O168 family O-antigen flippase [Escherichia coli]
MFRQINFKNLEIMKQILISFSFRLMGPVIMLLTTPQLLSTLGNVEYGVWSLLITTISWLTICDFGISNQIRNESKILIVQDNKESIREIYTAAVIISFFITLLCCVIISFINIDLIYKLFLSCVFLFAIETNICRALCLSLNKPELASAVTNIPNLFLLIYVFCYSSFNINNV